MSSLYNLVFSNIPRYRISRHILFWVLWISFFAFSETYRVYEYRHVNVWEYYPVSWGSMLIQMPIDIAFCYSVIYFLLPRFFLKGRYLSFIILWIVFVFAASYLESLYFYSIVSDYRVWMGLPPLKNTMSHFSSALEIVGSLNTEGGFAIAIKFGKMFAVKQKEASLLSRETEKLKAQFAQKGNDEIKPTFLFNVLNRIYSRAQEENFDTAGSLKKINDLILYTSYDAKKPILPLAKELNSLKEYTELEKISYPYLVEVKYTWEGNSSNKLIAPYILIPIAEYLFNSIGPETMTGPEIDINCSIQGNDLFMNFTGSKPAATSTLLGDKNGNLHHIEQRLKLLYPGGYRMKKTIGVDTVKIELYLNLAMQMAI